LSKPGFLRSTGDRNEVDDYFDEIAGRARDIIAGYVEAANSMFQMHKAFMEAGFSESQADGFCQAMLRGAKPDA
jgi:hypothetical protein